MMILYYQDDKDKLRDGYLLSDKKYKDWTEHNQDQIKKAKLHKPCLSMS